MNSNTNFRVVPWYCSAEWQHTHNLISSDDIDKKEEALKMILVWKARYPNLPSGIESTLCLLQVYVEDMRHNSAVTGIAANDHMLRMAYSTAIMRFVNHMLDCETEKGTSLYKAAKLLGVPDWIVDLRHETAHSSTLPSLKLLRDACSIALNWLKEKYWDQHKPYITDYYSGQKDYLYGDGIITPFINSCISLGICSLPNLKINTLHEIPDAAMREALINDLKEIFVDTPNSSDWSVMSIQKLIDLLNTHGKRLVKIKDVSTLVNEALLGDDSLFLSRELVYFFSANEFKYKCRLNSNYVNCFEVLLTFLHTNDLLLDFILALIKVTQLPASGVFKSRLSAIWCSEILSALNNGEKFQEKFKISGVESNASRATLKKLYDEWFPEPSYTSLILDLLKETPPQFHDIDFIQPIIAEYNRYLTLFVKDLLYLLKPGVSYAVAKKVCTLANIISMPEKWPQSATSNIYTADDIRITCDDVVVVENVPTMEDEQQDVNKFSNEVWTLASREYQWNSIPIGQVVPIIVPKKPN
ncbi:unnamed protein product [Chrysodeixis includens]|uniref:LAS1 protein n=1 Tax=Chrysodeixis includens TaxID=689277 RepID=A0A9P0FV45_CHRIL|nr:unnamed protein product [Chrysodeixis includens]